MFTDRIARFQCSDSFGELYLASCSSSREGSLRQLFSVFCVFEEVRMDDPELCDEFIRLRFGFSSWPLERIGMMDLELGKPEQFQWSLLLCSLITIVSVALCLILPFS